MGVGQAIARIERPEYDFTMSTLQLKNIEPDTAEITKNALIARSREKYGTARETVEQSLEYLKDEKPLEKEREPRVVHEEVKESIVPQSIEKVVEEISEPPLIAAVEEVVAPIEITDGKTKERLVRQKELSEHRYTQMYIKKMAEARGYVATIEQPTQNGGSVDILLEKNGKRIACEIGCTTTVACEVHNIQKCLDEGYEIVVALATNQTLMPVIQREIETQIKANDLSRVMVADSHMFLTYLDYEIASEASTEIRIKGYRVKTEYSNTSPEEQNMKRNIITQTILKSLIPTNSKT